MKHKPLLRLLALLTIVLSSIAFSAVHLHKKAAAFSQQHDDTAGNTSSKTSGSDVMIWESLSRHLLSFN